MPLFLICDSDVILGSFLPWRAWEYEPLFRKPLGKSRAQGWQATFTFQFDRTLLSGESRGSVRFWMEAIFIGNVVVMWHDYAVLCFASMLVHGVHIKFQPIAFYCIIIQLCESIFPFRVSLVRMAVSARMNFWFFDLLPSVQFPIWPYIYAKDLPKIL
jgi:hypothetical protein